MKLEADNIFNLLKTTHGIDMSKYDASFFNESLGKRIVDTNCNSTEEYNNYLKNNINEGVVLINSLNICYSEFFRNPLTFAVLEQVILPSLIQKRRNSKRKVIRILSVACTMTSDLAIILAHAFDAYSAKPIVDKLFFQTLI